MNTLQKTLASEIDYSAFQTGTGGANFQKIIPPILKSKEINNYEQLVRYLNSQGGLDQRTAPSRKYNVPSSILGLPSFGPATARAFIEHLKEKGLMRLIKRQGSKPIGNSNPKSSRSQR